MGVPTDNNYCVSERRWLDNMVRLRMRVLLRLKVDVTMAAFAVSRHPGMAGDKDMDTLHEAPVKRRIAGMVRGEDNFGVGLSISGERGGPRCKQGLIVREGLNPPAPASNLVVFPLTRMRAAHVPFDLQLSVAEMRQIPAAKTYA